MEPSGKQGRAALARSIAEASLGGKGLPPKIRIACEDAALAGLAFATAREQLSFGAPGPGPRSVSVEDADAVSACLEAAKSGAKVGALVFCSATRLGGGWANGAVAQEESLSLATTWALGPPCGRFHGAAHPDAFYSDAIVSKEVSILASPPGAWLDEPASAFFVGFAAPNMRGWASQGGDPSSAKSKARCLAAMEARCSAALSAMRVAGCQTAVCGAIGCGVFMVDPEIAAKAWSKAIAEQAGQMHVAFALGGSPSPQVAAAFAKLAAEFAPLAPKPKAP